MVCHADVVVASQVGVLLSLHVSDFSHALNELLGLKLQVSYARPCPPPAMLRFR